MLIKEINILIINQLIKIDFHVKKRKENAKNVIKIQTLLYCNDHKKKNMIHVKTKRYKEKNCNKPSLKLSHLKKKVN